MTQPQIYSTDLIVLFGGQNALCVERIGIHLSVSVLKTDKLGSR